MVIYEGSPPLTSLRIARTNHISPNRARRMLDSEFDLQLLVYLIFSPSGVLSAYSFDKLYMFSWNARSTDLIGSRTPTPEQLESLTVPTDDGIRFCDDESRFPTVPDMGQKHPEDSVARFQSRWPFFFS